MNMLGLLVYQLFFAGNVSVTQSVPASAKFNTDFTVEVTINKGETNSFAKLSIDMPEGLTVSPVETKGASFTFSNQSAKFIWTSLPADPSFKISYKVKVGAGATNGDKTISGKFAYVVDNVKQTVELASSTIKIIEVVAAPVAAAPAPAKSEPVAQTSVPTTSAAATETAAVPATTTTTETQPTTTTTEPSVAANTTTTEKSSTETVTPSTAATETATPVTAPASAPETTTTTPAAASAQTEAAKTAAPVAGVGAVRVLPREAEGEIKVELNVTKGNLSGFAKLQETIPAGLMALPVETMGATFTFVDQVAKFVWVSLPSQAEFKIVYKLVVTPGGGGEKTIEGLFSYIENDETKKSVIASGSVSVKEAAQQPAVATTPATTEESKPAEAQPASASAAETVAKTAEAATKSAETASAATTPNIPSPQSGVNYRVQIMALHRTIDVAYFANTYKLDDKVMVDTHEGWTKYTVGGFSEYRQGRDHRENIRSKGVVGPFVTAYNQGKRITVQEALMITNQKWYK